MSLSISLPCAPPSIHPDPPDTTNFPPLTARTTTDKNPITEQGTKFTDLSSYAEALNPRAQTTNKVSIKLNPRRREIINGKPIVVFTKEEHNILADTCRWTIIGKFDKSRPQIDKIRENFAKIVPTKGHVKIGAKDSKHVFIDVENEDYNTMC
ncbi:hypothetical protein MTR67_003612 [Solanum verrucosum]|uniref:DUF4283 domain-containing protein n=1 Tax=Solanum verrucosum TaxID=315347 RepID=A0AAF0PSU4_SOLVR|nr:hypothetical protein MTR67_003612 [Solanum verrucosum]